MRAQASPVLSIAAVITAACLSAPGAWAADGAFPGEPGLSPGQSGMPVLSSQPTAPSVNNEAFKKLRTQCESDAACSKAGGDVCAEAAALLTGADIPDAYREVKEDARVKFALRLLERGVETSNISRGRAYDWYNKVSFLGLSPYADPLRSQDLMDMMVKSGYPGGVLRKIRAQTSIIAFTASEAEKREGCATAKKILNEGKLDADSRAIAMEVVGSGICTGYEAPAKQ
jgi:hypothetical protein